jgi:TfoX/Sxy family transcriptional regulator of competence genes
MGMKPRSFSPEDEELVERIREALGPQPGVVEKRMFGGLAFMVRGHMCVGMARGNFMVRVGPEHYSEALARPEARPMDFTGRPLAGFVYVDRSASIRPWVARALRFVETLPRK